MTKVVLDAGALVAVDRGDRRVVLHLWLEHRERRPMITHAMVVAQVWRDPRQVQLARFLKGVDVASLDHGLGRRSGELLAATGSPDPIDAAVVLLADSGDRVLTSDSEDLSRLVEASGRDVRVVAL